MNTPKISVLHPTGRPHAWRESYEKTMCNADHPEQIEYVLSVHESNADKIEIRKGERIRLIVNHQRPTSGDNGRAAGHAATGKLFFVAHDDLYGPPHWDTEILSRIPDLDRQYVLHVATGSARDQSLMVPQIFTKARWDELVRRGLPDFESMYSDDDFGEESYADQVVIRALDIVFPHEHPIFGKRKWDEVYANENRPEAYESGRKLLEERRAARGMKPAVMKAIAICLPGETFNVRWVSAWTSLLAYCTGRYNVMPIFGWCSNVYVTRAVILDNVMNHSPIKPDYLLWIDDDNLVTPADLDQLLKDLDEHPEADGVAGWCHIQSDVSEDVAALSCGQFDQKGRCIPFTVDQLMSGSKDVKPIEYSGFPVFLMRTSLIEKVGTRAFTPRIMEEQLWGFAGEDVSFCYRATREHGCKLFVDRRVKVPHLKLRSAEPIHASAAEEIAA